MRLPCNLPATVYGLNRTFDGIPLAGKRVLEIGSGKGLMAIFAALAGAKSVKSMEPELDGSASGVLSLQRSRIDALKLCNMELIRADFNDWETDPGSIDTLLSFASINHLYESPYNALKHADTRERYLEIIGKMYRLLTPGGNALVTDACRTGLFALAKPLGIKPPWRWGKKYSINWKLHQDPNVWKSLFHSAGFRDVRISYPVPYRVRWAEPLFNNRSANFLLQGSFILKATR